MLPWEHSGQFTAVPGWSLSGKKPAIFACKLLCVFSPANCKKKKTKDFFAHEAKTIKNSITYHEIEYLGQIDEPRAWMLLLVTSAGRWLAGLVTSSLVLVSCTTTKSPFCFWKKMQQIKWLLSRIGGKLRYFYNKHKLCHLGAQDLDADDAELSQESRTECRTRSTQDRLDFSECVQCFTDKI